MTDHGPVAGVAWRAVGHFPLVDQYMGLRMGIDLSAVKPGRVRVVESARRLQREQSYGFIHALWWVWLADGRSAASVPPGAGEEVAKIVRDAHGAEQILEASVAERLKIPVSDALGKAGLKGVDRVLTDLLFACNATLLRRHACGDCRRLVDESIPPAPDLRLATHCFPDGIVYGVIADGRVASCAFAHRSGVMEDRIADIGITTASAYRRRGYAKTAVSAVVEHITRAGGEAKYGCSPTNEASRATARSVGFVPYGTSLILAAPAPDLKQSAELLSRPRCRSPIRGKQSEYAPPTVKNTRTQRLRPRARRARRGAAVSPSAEKDLRSYIYDTKQITLCAYSIE